jgi:hypothetical protein
MAEENSAGRPVDRRSFVGGVVCGTVALGAGALTAGEARAQEQGASATQGGPEGGHVSGDMGGADEGANALEEGLSPVPGYVCAYDWLGEPPKIEDSQIAETFDHEVVIIGGGARGYAGCARRRSGGRGRRGHRGPGAGLDHVVRGRHRHLQLPIHDRPRLRPV